MYNVVTHPLLQVTSMTRPTTEILCSNCNIKFYKENREINRAKKMSRKNFCSRSCAGINAAKNKYGEVNLLKHYLSSAKKTAKSKKLDFNLDLLYIEVLLSKQKNLCALTGIPIIIKPRWTKEHKFNLYYASLDRINNNKGYIKGNIQFVSIGANYLRNRSTIEETIKFIKSIHKAKK